MTGLPPHVQFPTHRVPGRDCPACGADGLRAFYAVQGVTVRADVLLTTADAAANFPNGDLELAICETCAFITNVAFDPATQARADEVATDSRSTGESVNEMVDRWAGQYDLRGKTIVDLGCGQGEFLEQLCQRTGARGVGFDPKVRRERSDIADVLFVADTGESLIGDVNADFIFSRHALEYIADPLRYLTALREPLIATPLAVEVNDTQRVLAAGAFWELGYGRNSFYTRESLTRVCQRAGFEVGRITPTDDDFVLDAEPTGGQKRDMPTLTELRQASQFARVSTTRMLEWMEFADDARRRGRRCAIWGGGAKAVSFLATLGIADVFVAVVDPDAARQGFYLPGTRLKVESAEVLRNIELDVVLVIDPQHLPDVRRELTATKNTPSVTSL